MGRLRRRRRPIFACSTTSPRTRFAALFLHLGSSSFRSLSQERWPTRFSWARRRSSRSASAQPSRRRSPPQSTYCRPRSQRRVVLSCAALVALLAIVYVIPRIAHRFLERRPGLPALRLPRRHAADRRRCRQFAVPQSSVRRQRLHQFLPALRRLASRRGRADRIELRLQPEAGQPVPVHGRRGNGRLGRALSRQFRHVEPRLQAGRMPGGRPQFFRHRRLCAAWRARRRELPLGDQGDGAD